MTSITDTRRHAGRTALVTGGGSGLGAAICRRLAAEGARVAVVDRNLAGAEQLAAEIGAQGGQAVAFQADVTDYASIKAAVDGVVQRFGRLDVAVNNAGIGPGFMPTAEHSLESWNQVLAVNLTGVFHSMKAELPHMQAAGGAVVNIASVSALVALAGVAPYVASKHGVLGLTKTAALEYGQYGIRVTAVCPTFVKTPLTTVALKEESQWQALDAQHAIGRCATPEDVAAMVAFLSSADGAVLTGCAYPVDGGYSAP
jgi:NAD(P)-dependent dehydrogenase (short-subunit alcohol dehydrogenase family)